MYAVVEIAGKQYKIEPNDKIYVPTLKDKVGSKIKFDRVLLIGADKEIKVGNPLVTGASVEGRVVDHGKADRVIVFKKKKRKGYRVKRGHRQAYTHIEITSIAQ